MIISPARLIFFTAALLACAAAAQAQDRVYALLHSDRSGSGAAQMEAGAQEQAAASGARIVVHDAGRDPLRQAETVTALVGEGVQGIILVAIDANGVVAAVNEAEAAGVPVVAVDVELAEAPEGAQIRTNDETAAAALGQFIAGLVTAEGEAVTMGVIGAPSSTLQTARIEGFLRAIEGVPLILPGGFVDGANLVDISSAAGVEMLEANPEINALFASGDAALLGAIAAAEASNRHGEIAIYGWGLSLPVIEAIEDGRVRAVVYTDPAGLGRAAVEALDLLASGGTPDPIIDVPTTIVTLQNVHEFRPLFSR